MKVNGHERQRYQALILVQQGYSHREVAEILLVDEDTVGRWVRQYQERGLGGLRNDEGWGGEHGQRELPAVQVEELKRVLGTEAMAGTKVGSGWTNKAVRHLIGERFGLTPNAVVDVLNASSGRSFYTEHVMADHVLTGAYATGFALGLLSKDVGIAAAMAADRGVEAPLCAVVEQRWSSAVSELGPTADHSEAHKAWSGELTVVATD